MTYLQLAFVHIATVFPAFLIGTYILLNKKGTRWHKRLGKVYMLLMLFTGLITLFMPAKIGPTFFNHFGLIHLLSVLALYTVPTAFYAARRGDIKSHKNSMVSLYVGGILIAGGLTLLPGRLLNSWLLG